MLPLAILVGGYATRLGLVAQNTPKCLIDVNGRPFIDWQLDLLIENGYSDFVFCASYKSEMIKDYLGDGASKGIRIQYSYDGETQLGTGGAVLKAIPKLGKEFGVVYGDSYLPINYSVVEQAFLSLENKSLMAVYENENQFDLSNVEFIDGKLIAYEKGAERESMRHIDYGITYFRASAFDSWVDQLTFDLSKVCHQLANHGQLEGYEVFERFYEIGSIQGIQDFSHYLRKARL